MTASTAPGEVEISTLADRPHLLAAFYELPTSWPEFMRHDPIGHEFYARVEQLAEWVFVATGTSGALVARACSVPCDLDAEDLPPDGWNAAIRRGIRCLDLGTAPTTVSAVEIAIDPAHQGSGLAAPLVAAMRENARRHGFDSLVAPVRPNAKTDPHEPMTDYVRRTRSDGLPEDPWLRVHARAGATLVTVAPRSMFIPGTLAEWRAWTGLPFDASGPVVVPGALVPVYCSAEHGVASYVEPNVWMRHAV